MMELKINLPPACMERLVAISKETKRTVENLASEAIEETTAEYLTTRLKKYDLEASFRSHPQWLWIPEEVSAQFSAVQVNKRK